MDAVETLTVPLTENLSWAEIQARFPYQHVVLLEEDEDTTRGIEAIRGRVVSHAKNPMELVASHIAWQQHHALVGLHYTGVGMPDEDRGLVHARR